MAFNPAHLENLSASSMMRSDNPGKGTGKRKRHSFKLKARRFNPPQFIPRSQLPKKYRSSTFTEILNPYRREALEDNPYMKATTARVNDGMSYLW